MHKADQFGWIDTLTGLAKARDNIEGGQFHGYVISDSRRLGKEELLVYQIVKNQQQVDWMEQFSSKFICPDQSSLKNVR